MLNADEIARSAGGAWALFKGDPRGLREFDLTYEGFWRSFAVLILLIPAFGILIASERIFLINQLPVTEETFPAGAFLSSRIVEICLGWVDYPLILALLARPLGLQKRYVPLIVALNWTSLIAIIPIAVPHLLHVLGVIDDAAASFLGLFALGVVLRYQYVVTRIATGGPVGFSAGLVVLDFLCGIALSAIVSAVMGL